MKCGLHIHSPVTLSDKSPGEAWVWGEGCTQAVIDVNLSGVFLCSQAAAKVCLGGWGGGRRLLM